MPLSKEEAVALKQHIVSTSFNVAENVVLVRLANVLSLIDAYIEGEKENGQGKEEADKVDEGSEQATS
jgi:hypothetical protein